MASIPKIEHKMSLQNPFKTPEDVVDWVLAYGRNPDVEKLIPAIKTLDELDLQISAFVAKILNEYPQMLNGCLKELNVEGISHDKSKGILEAVWLSELDNRTETLQSISKNGKTKWIKKVALRLLSKKPIDPYKGIELDDSTPKKLDILWGHYFYSNKSTPVEKIVEVASLLFKKIDEEGKKAIEKAGSKDKSDVPTILVFLGKSNNLSHNKSIDMFKRFCVVDDNLYKIVLENLGSQIKKSPSAQNFFRNLCKERQFKLLLEKKKTQTTKS